MDTIFLGFLFGFLWPVMYANSELSKAFGVISNNSVRSKFIIGLLIQTLFIGVLICVGCSEWWAIIMVILGIYDLFGVFCMAFDLFGVIKAEKRRVEEEIEAKKKREDEEKRNPQEFYSRCYNQGIVTLDAKADRARAELIAKDFIFDDFEVFFNTGRKMYAPIIEEEKQRELSNTRYSEKKKCSELTRYAELFGREKLLMALGDEILELEKRLSELIGSDEAFKKTSATYLSSFREKDWAIAGGIAEGIAGPAAGLATALHVQGQNAEMRAMRDDMMKVSAIIGAANMKSRYDLEEKIAEAKKAYAIAESLLVEEISPDLLIKKLDLRNAEVKISETGAFTVSVTAWQDSNLMIYDTVSAVIDGTISADFYQNNKKVGSALLVLPKYGTSNHPAYLNGICLEGAKKDAPYEVKFSPYKLWAIEKKELYPKK